MNLVYSALAVLHVVGIVAIGYGFFKALAKKTYGVNVAMLHGASTQLLTGVVMVGLRESGIVEDEEALVMSKIALKLLIALVIIAMYSIGKRKAEQKLYLGLIGALTLTNIVIAVAL
jgi:hypothetical protein